MTEMLEVSPQTAKEWLDLGSAMLIDVREHHEVAQFAIPGAVHNPMSRFDFDSVPSGADKKLVFVCAHGMRSQQVGQYLLQEKRVSEAYNLTGGVAAWAQAGLPNQT